MKYLAVSLLLIVLYELVKHFQEEIYKNWKNKYFCKKVSERIKPSKQGKMVVSCDKFNIVVHHDNTFHLYLGTNFIANWSYKNDEVKDLSIISEELFNSFKEKYILEIN